MMLYVHIPFCISKCKYCDFLSFYADDNVKDDYMRALFKEIETVSEEIKEKYGRRLTSIYLGGGTPPMLGTDRIQKLLKKIRDSFVITEDCEITMEINPASIDVVSLRSLYRAGINRLSIGLQTTEDEILEFIGRTHTFDDFLQVYADARYVGFNNISVDLMAALPGQTLESYAESVRSVISRGPEHISCYSLSIEDKTPMSRIFERHPEIFPDEETDRKMYRITKRLLKEAGYKRYEISNYSLPGKESRHNNGYWTNLPYVGVGLGASSYLYPHRRKNVADMETYLTYWDSGKGERYGEDIELKEKDSMAEFFYLGLRRMEGIYIEDFKYRFDKEMVDVYGDVLDRLQEQKLITYVNRGVRSDLPLGELSGKSRIRLTEYGIDVSNYVFSQFILSDEDEKKVTGRRK